MKPKPSVYLEQFRIRTGPLGSDPSWGNNGRFIIPGIDRKSRICLIVSDGGNWEHVSVSIYRRDRCPTWEEMCHAKDLLWGPEERVVQYHPPESEYVRNHAYVLHLWKPTGVEMPHPPHIFVGTRSWDEDMALLRKLNAGRMVR